MPKKSTSRAPHRTSTPSGSPALPTKAGAPTVATLRPARPTPPSKGAGQPENRWQRTVRYGWDKGGSRGGRR